MRLNGRQILSILHQAMKLLNLKIPSTYHLAAKKQIRLVDRQFKNYAFMKRHVKLKFLKFNILRYFNVFFLYFNNINEQ